MTSDAPRASVVIVSRDRAEELAGALDAVEAQRLSWGRFEVVVVDDGSIDDTPRMLASRWRSPDGRWRPGRVVIRNDPPLRPGRARNRGVERAGGAILVFTDSDCRPAAGWLEELLAPFEDAGVGAAGGAEIDDRAAPPLARAAHFALTSPLTTGRVRGGAGRRVGTFRPRSFSMAVRREAFDRAGGFADAFYGEDVDLSLRVARLGLATVFAPRSRVHHRRRGTWRGIGQQAFAMGRARARLMRTDRGHAEPVYALPALAVSAVAALAVAAAWSPAARTVGVAALLVSAGVAVALGWQAWRAADDARVAWRAPLVFALQQAAYGVGFLTGMLRPARAEPLVCSAR